MAQRVRLRLAVWKFASCDGCQLSLLDCEDELLAVAGQLDIAYFAEASRRMMRGPYDLSLVEGSITTPADAERILQVRRLSRHLVTIGACATAGRVGMWRGGGRLGMTVSAPFVWRCLSGSAIAPFPHPSHRTQRADLSGSAAIAGFCPHRTHRAALPQWALQEGPEAD